MSTRSSIPGIFADLDKAYALADTRPMVTRRRFLQGLIAAYTASATASASKVFPLQKAAAEAIVPEDTIGQVCWTLYSDGGHLYLHGRMVGYDIASRRTLVGDWSRASGFMEEIENTLRAKVVEKFGEKAALPAEKTTRAERQRLVGQVYR